MSLLSCRLTCHRFKYLVDDLLEKQQMSLWNWSKYYGEAKPFVRPGPSKRHLPVNKIFSKTADITNFLNEMNGHLTGNLNPFPSRSIYLRRVKSNPPPSPPSTSTSDDNYSDNLESFKVDIYIVRNRFGGLGLNDNQEENEAYLLSLSQINHLLTTFGSHLTSLIFECGATSHLISLDDLQDILEKVPNLQYLMLKGIRIHKGKTAATSEHLQTTFKALPPLPNLKSVKVIRCHDGIMESLIYAYHNQLECFQAINSRDNYFPPFKNVLQQQLVGDSDKWSLVIFGNLRELKFGEFERCKKFDQFVEFLKGEDGITIFPKLDNLSLYYDVLGNFCDNPLEKLLEPLQYLPRLKEFNVGICGSTGFKFGENEKNGKFTLGGGGRGGKLIKRLSIPVQMIGYPNMVERLVREMPALEMVRFLRNNEEDGGSREEFKEAMEQVVYGMLNDFRGLNKVEIVDIIGDKEILVCEAIR